MPQPESVPGTEPVTARPELVDQTPSERVLHRVLYLIKFLRAMVLHIGLVLLAALLFATTGTRGVYPIADSVIDAMRIGLGQQRASGGAGAVLYGFLGAAVLLMILAFLVWVYRSITGVRRRALRVQAALMVVVVAHHLSWSMPALRLAFVSLDPLFATLSALAVLSLLLFWTSFAIALWQVSRATETSSLVATLDPRLVSGPWAYFNKLLDLPRTPLARPATAGAYLLALGGSLLLVASFMHLVTLGGVTSRLSALAGVCNDAELAALCRDVAANWASPLPWTLLLALLGIKAAAWAQALAKRIGGLSVADVLRHPDDRFVLYLRPFETDAVILPRPRLPWLSRLFSFRPHPVRLEEELFDVADGYRPLIAVGQPGTHRAVAAGVAYRDFLDDSRWQAYVSDKIRRAERIVLVMNRSAGVRWEIDQVLREGALCKTLFLLDPAIGSPVEWARLRDDLPPVLKALTAASEAAGAGCTIGLFHRRGSWVQIVNANRSATSYRTAFSCFLAEQQAASDGCLLPRAPGGPFEAS